MPTVTPGSPVTITADTMGTRPKWLRWTSTGNAGGMVALPSGHRRLVSLSGSTRASEDYYVTPQTIGSTDARWRAVIYASNGSHVFADGLRGIPTIGTPTVRLQADAPAKAVMTIPAHRSGGPLSPTFNGWSDGHTEAVGRGMELTVEYRKNDGTMAMVFRGMVYQIISGETVQIVAYDRMMDLYQFSDQYQSTQGFRPEALPLTGTSTDYYLYTASETPGAIISAVTASEISINAQAYETVDGRYTSDLWIVHDLPLVQGVTAKQGSRIKQVSMIATQNSAVQYRGVYSIGLFKVNARPGGIRATLVAETDDKYVLRATSVLTWTVDWTVEDSASDYVIGVHVRSEGYSVGGTTSYKGTTTPVTVPASRFYSRIGNGAAGTEWVFTPVSQSSISVYPEVAIMFDSYDAIPVNDVAVAGMTISVPKADVVTPNDGSLISTPSPAYRLDVSYQVYNGTSISSVVTDLLTAAGVVPDIPGGSLLGMTTYYTSSTYDYLTCILELIKGSNFGARASITEPGRIEVRPRETIDDSPIATFSTAPGGSAEHTIVSHNITAHWMAEKATQAILAENATTSGLPLAIESDDRLLEGSLAEELQSPLRGITADSSMGTHLLLATSAGGQMIQLHTNVYEGEIVLAGYRTEIWNLSGSKACGRPIGIEVPEYGARGTAIPTAVEFGGGCTKVSLDNIRTADRSEVARSMGLTGDAISNTARTLPNTSYVFARYDDYASQEGGIATGYVTEVEFLQDGGTVLASQSDANFIKTVEDAAGYFHICAVLPASVGGYAASTPISAVRFTMAGVARTAVLDNPKYALGGQALHADIRFRHA